MEQLIVVGASVRAAAQSAARAGFLPYGIDRYGDQDLAEVCPAAKVTAYPHGFLPALDAAPEARWIYTGGLENYPRVVEKLAQARPLLGNGGEVLRKAREPDVVAEAALKAGLAFPAMRRDGALAGQWLVKSRKSSGGLAVRFAQAGVDAPARSGKYFQEYIEGQAASAVFVGAQGHAVLLGATRQLIGRDFGLTQPFLYAGSIAPLEVSAEDAGKLKSLGDCLAKRCGLEGLFNVDFVRTKEQWWVLEVNPRYSASVEVLERALGMTCIALHVAACARGEIPAILRAADRIIIGKAIVYASRNGVVPQALEDLAADWNRQREWPQMADLPRVGDQLQAGQPVVTVFATGDTMDSVESDLRKRVEVVREALRDEANRQ